MGLFIAHFLQKIKSKNSLLVIKQLTTAALFDTLFKRQVFKKGYRNE